MSEPASTAMIAGPGEAGRQMPRGVRGGIIAAGRGAGLTGLALAGLGLLLVMLLGLFLVAVGFGVMAEGSLPSNQRAVTVAVLVLGGLVLTLTLTVPALLGIRQLARLTRELTGQWAGRPIADPYQPPRPGQLPFRIRLRWLATDPATRRDLAWAVLGPVYGLLTGALPAIAIVTGFLLTGSGLGRGFGSSSSSAAVSAKPGAPGLTNVPTSVSHTHSAGAPLEVLFGLTLVCLGVAVAPWLLRGYAGLARTLLAPTGQAELAQRVDHLTQTRIETIDSGAAEIRRIERDLHDGAQARLVAVGMTLGAAEDLIGTRPDAARALLAEARASSVLALAELRALVRGIHPPVLADRGLADAIRALALDSGLRVEVAADLPGRPPPPVESAAYFAVCELLANVSKHAGTRQAWIDLRHERGMLRVDVADDGSGGADPTGGTGLRGIERRVAAFDGILALNSPAGGPTVVTMEIPCALSSPKTSSY
jgi:signal transduction histidine kinase